jgi:hypothetical protein
MGIMKRPLRRFAAAFLSCLLFRQDAADLAGEVERAPGADGVILACQLQGAADAGDQVYLGELGEPMLGDFPALGVILANTAMSLCGRRLEEEGK